MTPGSRRHSEASFRLKAPVSWIREYAALPEDVSSEQLAQKLTRLGLKVEALERAGDAIVGVLAVGEVLTVQPELQSNGKTINWCTVSVGEVYGNGEPLGIVCGAHNFSAGDLVVVALPGTVLPGKLEISERRTYGHLSAGMICSAHELGIGDDHEGIVVLPAEAGAPGDDARVVLGFGDDVIELEINPDRAYALSVRGIARDAALGFGVAFSDPCNRPVPESDAMAYDVKIESDTGCDAFSGRAVTGFDPASPTPPWMARRLVQCGIRPISLAVDVTNYVMLETGQPIHGYDRDRLRGPIRVRNARAGEVLRTLDGVDRELSTEDVLITDDSGPIGLAGVMGGETTELSPTTTSIFIEAAHWEPARVFRTGKRHKLGSEAARRFERGVDPTITLQAADRVAELLVEHGGGRLEPKVTHVATPQSTVVISFDPTLPSRRTGVDISIATTTAALIGVGCLQHPNGDRLEVTVPPWRPDIRDPADLVEEVARVVGYDKIPSAVPVAPAGRGLTHPQQLRRRAGRVLAGEGYIEVVSFPFIGDGDLDRLGLDSDDVRRRTLHLANPLSNQEPAMATTLLPGMLKTIARNVGRGATSFSLFEMTSVTYPMSMEPAPILGVDRRPSDAELRELQDALPDQPMHLAVTATGDREFPGWWGAGRRASWADAVDAVRAVAESFGLELEVTAGVRAPWHPGRCAVLSVAGELVGHAGELHPRVCHAYGVPVRTAAAEVDLDVLIRHAVSIIAAPMVSDFPIAKEDVALVVADDVPAATVEAALRAGAGDLLEKVYLFDVYTGAQIGPGKKSLAFALRFRASDRTLTEAETAQARAAAVAAARERCGAVQR